MPAGKVHTRYNLIFLTYFVLFSKISFLKYYILGYLFSTFLCNPDNDLIQNDAEEGWGRFQFIWRPYAWIFKHRNISHWFVIGTLTRVIYLLIVLPFVYYLFYYIFYGTFPVWKTFTNIDYLHFKEFVIGMIVADLSHTILDYISTSYKRQKFFKLIFIVIFITIILVNLINYF